MRLIGGKDYYDNVVGFDTDPNRKFIRKSLHREVLEKYEQPYNRNNIDPFYVPYFDFDQTYNFKTREHRKAPIYHCIPVIFCGKIYFGIGQIKVETSTQWSAWDGKEYKERGKSAKITAEVFWTVKAALEAFEKVKYELPEKPLKGNGMVLARSNIEELMQPVSLSDNAMKYCIDNNIVHGFPIHTTNKDWYFNTDSLNVLHFANAVDPWQAYQQIDMWVGSQLAKEEDKQVKLSDKSLLDKHGFDSISFRNTHHTSKPRRKQK